MAIGYRIRRQRVRPLSWKGTPMITLVSTKTLLPSLMEFLPWAGRAPRRPQVDPLTHQGNLPLTRSGITSFGVCRHLHLLAQNCVQPVLVPFAVLLEPMQHVGVKANGYGFFYGTVKLASLCTAPIGYSRDVRGIYVVIGQGRQGFQFGLDLGRNRPFRFHSDHAGMFFILLLHIVSFHCNPVRSRLSPATFFRNSEIQLFLFP